jgi:hypothetical protein
MNSEDEVVERIGQLTRAEVLEAVLALRDDVPEAAGADSDPAQAFLGEVEASPFRDIEAVEELARATLIVAALDPDSRDRTAEIVGAVGKKAFIFGGMEIIAAATIATIALQVVLSRGKKSEEETTEIVTEPDGRTVIRKNKKTVYGLSGKAAAVLSSIIGH